MSSTNKKLLIIDADSMVWSIAYKFRNKKIKNLVLASTASWVASILEKTDTDYYIGFLASDAPDRKPNFRYAVSTVYKKTRPESPDWFKKWSPIIKEYLHEQFKFQFIDGMEVDDACSILAAKEQGNYDIIVASPDKDLKQIPNVTLFDYTKNTSTQIEPFAAALSLGQQLLQGDSTDNIQGLPKIGKVKAASVLEPCTTKVGIKWTVFRMYYTHFDYLHSLKMKNALSVIRKTEKDKYKDTDLTATQVQRQFKLLAEKEADDWLAKELPNGWKTFYRTQYNLLKLLTEHDTWVSDPYTIVDKPDDVEVPAITIDELSGSNDFAFN